MNNDYTVQKAEYSDIDAIAAIEAECIPEPWSKNAFLTELKKDSSVILKAVNKDGIICGFITADVILGEVSIYNVVVSEAYRRQGIARMLLTELERMTQGAESYMLEVRESNIPAISLYKSLGYENVGIRKNFYSAPCENAILMTKIIRNKPDLTSGKEWS